MPKPKKQPKYKTAPNPQKQPKIIVDPQAYYQQNPAWRIAKIELASRYGWQSLDSDTVQNIHAKLSHFESMTWWEILLDSKKQNHTVPISNLSKWARDRLIEISLDDLDELTSLRLSATERVWGILDQGIMYLLWWDPRHEIYPSQKKNT